MNLKIQLFYRIVVIATFCLAASTAYVLYLTDKQAISEAKLTLTRIDTQMQAQLIQMYIRYDISSPFPNTDLWPDHNDQSGSCISFLSKSELRRRNICNEIDESSRTWPLWFSQLYRQFFSPDFAIKKPVSFNAASYGTIVVTLNAHTVIARAWTNLNAVISILFLSIFSVCVLVYFTINQMLKPAQLIVTGLEKMQQGDLNTRLPLFDVKEWKQTSVAINQLAITQQQIMADNQKLALKLMNIQEEEHRIISRELHDEFGQCLAAINAITSSIKHTAQSQSPALLSEINSISPITHHMMDVLKNMLTRLRPIEIDELGLQACLTNLINSWNNHANGVTDYQLNITAPIDQLPEPLPANIYRIVQECLTNIAKHADASHAQVEITHQSDNTIQLSIVDNGQTLSNNFDNPAGVGLLGIRERVSALGGDMTLSSPAGQGFSIVINIPITINGTITHE